MELNRRSYLCRLCLCCDDSFACIFEDNASDQYNIASLLGELLQLKVSENDGYPKHICLSCRKTVTDFKTFKQNCLKAMIRYNIEIRIPENGKINQRLKGDEIDNTTFTMGFLKQETNADDLDAFGNPLTKDECSLSYNELPSSIPGVDCDETENEPGVPKDSEREVNIPAVAKTEDDLDQDYHQNATLTAASIDDVDEYCNSIDRKTSLQDCHNCPICGMEFHLLSLLDLHLKSHEMNPPQLENSEIIVDHVKEENNVSPGVLSTDFEVNHESNPVEQSSRVHKVEEDEDATSGEVFAEEIPIEIVEHPIKIEPANGRDNEDATTESVTSLSSEQNPESRFLRLTDLMQKKVNRVKLNVNLLQDKRKRTLDLESKGCESNGTSVEFFRTFTSSELDKSNEDEIQCIQQGDSLIASDFQSGRTTTNEECHSFEEEEGEGVSWKLRNTDVKKRKDDEGDVMFSYYNCDHCSKVFNDISSLNMHLSLHERNVSVEGKEVTSANTEVNKNDNANVGGISYNCRVCGKNFQGKSNLEVHMRTHSGEKPYECHICHQMFRHKCHRDQHVVHIHERYRCNYCHKLFHVKDELAGHVQECRIKRVFRCNRCNKCFNDDLSRNEHLSTHTTEEVFKCRYCGKCFTRRFIALNHERIHTGERSFICSICGKSFIYKSNLNVHMRMHMNDKRYKCGYCDKSFIHSSYLRRHERTHMKEKPFRCSCCDKSFSSKSYVKEHERIHRGGGKEFGCSFCGKHFSLSSSLYQHKKIHQKTKSFECNICKKSFFQKRYVRNHMKVHKKENK